jgi:hypothetical protein
MSLAVLTILVPLQFSFGSSAFAFLNSSVIEDAIFSLEAIGELSADVECDSSELSFTDGFIAMRGIADEHLAKGSSGDSWIRDGYQLNRLENGVAKETLDWGGLTAFERWRWANGIEDVRAPLLVAAKRSDMVESGTEMVGGIVCLRLEGGNIRLWFDNVHRNRLIRFEADYEFEIASGDLFDSATTFESATALAVRAEFDDWQIVDGQNSEFPLTSSTTHFTLDGEIEDFWIYEFSNVTTGPHLEDALFEIAEPTGGLGGQPQSGGGFGF